MGQYIVTVGNMGTVYEGSNKREATAHYNSYRFDSRTGYGRAAGEVVCMLADGELIAEFDPTAPKRKNVKWKRPKKNKES